MKLRKRKKEIPAWFRKELYEQYKVNMTMWNKPIKPYKEWLIEVFNTKI